jgi:hypothetical protein
VGIYSQIELTIISSSVKGSPTEAVKLASESFLAIMRLCLRASDGAVLGLLDELTNAIQIPQKVVQVSCVFGPA